MEEFEIAKQDLRWWLSDNCNPDSKEGKIIARTLKEKEAAWKKKQKGLFGAMFGGKGMYDEKKGIRKPAPPRKIEDMPKVFMDVKIGEADDAPVKKVVFALYENTVPKTAENFKQLCIGGKKGKNPTSGEEIELTYKGK